MLFWAKMQMKVFSQTEIFHYYLKMNEPRERRAVAQEIRISYSWIQDTDLCPGLSSGLGRERQRQFVILKRGNFSPRRR